MTAKNPEIASATVAEVLLGRLRERGIEHLFVNAGTDFAPIVEAYARGGPQSLKRFPRPVLAAHENLAAGMAHGAFLVTGQAQAVMFHVSVGTANATCAILNATRDNAAVVVMAGRSPVLESGALGARDTRIQWGQEVLDQAAMVRQLVKWDFELHDARNAVEVLDRGLAIATAQPQGPVYVSLPREVLAEHSEQSAVPTSALGVPTECAPDPEAIRILADRLHQARLPVIVTSSLGHDPRSVTLLGSLAERFGIGVVEAEPRRMNLPAAHPNHLGYSTTDAFASADVICFIECPVPWVPTRESPNDGAFVVQVASDPLYVDYPLRSHKSDLAIASAPIPLLRALLAQLETSGTAAPARVKAIADMSATARERTSRTRSRESAAEGRITKAFASSVLAEFLGGGRILFNEYWVRPDLLGLSAPQSYFYLPLAGGLGWGLPAALGARYADPGCTPIAAVGDGAYMFANPAACHHVAAKYGLPVLTVIADNGSWNAVDLATRVMYPEGVAAQNGTEIFSDLSPSPALERYVEASGGVGFRVSKREDLRDVLKQALVLVEKEKRQAVVSIDCA